jgi:hypothetical protein
MTSMTGAGGRRKADAKKSSNGPLVELGAWILGSLIGIVAWFLLVGAAIDFGGSAKEGKAISWLFMLLATLGAIACLVLVMLLVNRTLIALGILGRKQTVSEHRHLGPSHFPMPTQRLGQPNGKVPGQSQTGGRPPSHVAR